MSDNNKPTPMLRYDHNDAHVLSIDTKYDGFFQLNEYSLKHKLFSGEQSATFTLEVFERGDAVVVLLYDEQEDKVLLLEQFRVGAMRGGVKPWMLECVAGMFDSNETPEEVAIRETKEEANIDISADDLSPILEYFPSPGGTSEYIHLYLAKFDSTQVQSGSTYGLAEENEDILLHLITRPQALALLAEGKITNAATIIGLQWLALNYQNI